MRRSTLATLANLARTASLGVSLVAAGTAAVWTWAPDRVVASAEWLAQQQIAPVQTRWQDAAANPDPDAQTRQLAALLDELDAVAPGERFAPLVLDSLQRLARHHAARGEPAAAVTFWRQAVAFDPTDLGSRIELGDLLAQRAETRREGLELLQGLVQRPNGANAMTAPTFPGEPRLVAILARHLLALGHARDVIDLLGRALAEPTPGVWTVEGTAAVCDPSATCRAELQASTRDGACSLQWRLGFAVEALRIHLPPGTHAELVAPRLLVTTTTGTETLDLLQAKLHELEPRADRVVATGGRSASFSLAREFPAGALLQLQTAWSQRRPAELLAVARQPDFAALEQGLGTPADAARLASWQEWRRSAAEPR